MKKILLLIVALVAFANAELQSVKYSPEEKSNDGLKAFIGVSGGNVLVADDGAIFANLRIGLDINPLLSTGVWVSRLLRSVGGFVELFPVRINDFSISVPIEIGGGALYVMEPDDEAFESEDYFFTADMAVHFNYRVTKMLEISIGGGYRMFTGIESNGLENLDFCTPFGELRFTIRE